MPLTLEAEQQLRMNNVNHETCVKWLEVDHDSLFDSLYESKIFQEINARVGSDIDDYEEDFIDSDDIAFVLKSIETTKRKTADPSIQFFLQKLEQLALEAIELSRPLLFVL